MRLAVTVCKAGDNCIKDDTLCRTPKKSVKKTTTTTTGAPPKTTKKPVVSLKTTSPTTTSTDGGEGKPQAFPQKGKSTVKPDVDFFTVS